MKHRSIFLLLLLVLIGGGGFLWEFGVAGFGDVGEIGYICKLNPNRSLGRNREIIRTSLLLFKSNDRLGLND